MAEIKAALKAEKGLTVDRVLATTDEHDTGFLDEVRAQGWVMLDHDGEKTIETHGLWCALSLPFLSSARL